MRVEEIRIEGEWVIAQVQTAPMLIDLSEIQLLDENKDSVAVAGERISLWMKLINRGGLNAADLRIRLVTDDPYVEIVHEEVAFDDLGIGRETFVPKGDFPVLRFRDDFVGTHTAQFALHVFANWGLVDVRELSVTGVSPRQQVREVVVVDPLGNNDGMVQPGEFVRVEPILEVERPELMRVFEFFLRPLQEEVIEVSGPSIDFDLSTRPVRPRQAPEFLLPSTVEPGSRLNFEFQVWGSFGEWRDTLSVVLQAGLDRTPPRVGGIHIHPAGRGVRFILPETQILDGSEVQKVEVAIYAATDTSRLATVPLVWRDNRYEGTWEADEPDTYLLRPSAEDAYGNRGEGAIQAFYAIVEDVITGPKRDSGPWHRVELPGEGGVPVLTDLFMAPNHPEVMYASSSQTGVWRSANGGLSWERTGMMVGMEILIDAQDPFTLYTAGLRPQKSQDGGVTWASLAHPDMFLLTADSVVPGRLFGWQNDDTRLMLSEDGADSWQETEADSISWVQGHPADPKVVYAGQPYRLNATMSELVPGFICHSEDGGRTWVRHELNQAFWNFALDPHNPAGVYATIETAFWHSPDSGASWQALSNLPGSYGQLDLVIHPHEPGRLMAWNYWPVSEPGCWVSRDGGWHWEEVEIPEGVRLNKVALHPFDSDQVFAVVSGSRENAPSPLLHSHDVGVTWEKVALPMQEPQTGTVFFDRKGRRYIGASRADDEGEAFLGIYMSEDGGSTWEWRGHTQNIWYGSVFPGALDILSIDPFEPNRMLTQMGWDIMLSEDGGRTWNPIDLDRNFFSNPINTHILADPQSPGVYYLGIAGVYRSRNFGKTWEKRSEGLPKWQLGNQTAEASIRDLALDPQNTGILFAATRDTVWESQDAGLNWQYAGHIGEGESIRALAVHPHKPKELYAAAVDGLYVSQDQGQNWDRVIAFERTGRSYESKLRIRFAPDDPERFYLVTGLELLETQDGGKSWQSIGKNLAGYPWFNDVAVDPSDPDGVYAATPWGMYRLERNEGSTIVEGQQVLPAAFSLQLNYPNPFNSSTVIRFSLSKSTEAEVIVYNLAGQQVATLVNGVRPAGNHTVRWDGRDDDGRILASGVYLYRLRAGGHAETRKLLLLR